MDKFMDAWNRHDAHAFAAVFADDVDFTNCGHGWNDTPKKTAVQCPTLAPQPRKPSVGVVKFERFGNIDGKSLSATPNHFARVAPY